MSNIKQNKEIWMILLISILVSFILSSNTYFIEKYNENELNSILLPVFGVLLGSLITAYTLLTAFKNQIPIRVRNTKAYKRTNIHFLVTLLALWILIIVSLSFYFFEGYLIMFINLFLSIFSLLMFFYLIIVIYQLIRIINNN